MPSTSESEWQKKFNKTSPQNNTETWQNRFKKPIWQQDTRTWKEKFTPSTKLVYKPINKYDDIKQPAAIFADAATWWAGNYFFQISIYLKKDGALSVFVRARAPIELVPQTTLEWDVMVRIEINGIIYQEKHVENDPKIPRLLPLDHFTTIGDVNLKLPAPPPYPFNQEMFLIIEGGYTIDTGNGLIQPQPRTAKRKYPINIIEQPSK